MNEMTSTKNKTDILLNINFCNFNGSIFENPSLLFYWKVHMLTEKVGWTFELNIMNSIQSLCMFKYMFLYVNMFPIQMSSPKFMQM